MKCLPISVFFLSVGLAGHFQVAAADLLTEPFLQLPDEDSVRVVWFTDFEDDRHLVEFGPDFADQVTAQSTRVSRLYEDERSPLFDELNQRLYTEVTQRPVWRHEALVSGLSPGERIPYRVTSSAGSEEISSEAYSLRPLPAPSVPVTLLLASDLQNRDMGPATFQKVEEAYGSALDLILIGGDYVDYPHRASEWFDSENFSRPAFFQVLQGTYEGRFSTAPYRGGELIQHIPLMGIIGNHEVNGRSALYAEGASIEEVFDQPQPRWFAEWRYDQLVSSGELVPPSVEADAFRRAWIRDQSFEFETFLDLFTHPDSGPGGESYWSKRVGDVFVIGMNVSRMRRSWRADRRGTFTEDPEVLNDPAQWGFGDILFEPFGSGSEQYDWLRDELMSAASRTARYRIVLVHQSVFGLGQNAIPVLAQPSMRVSYLDETNTEQVFSRTFPLDMDLFASEVLPLAEAGRITSVTYDYPLEDCIWRRDIEPLLIENDVHLVYSGHSHLWNRTRVGGLNYLESSNYSRTSPPGFQDFRERGGNIPLPGGPDGPVGPDPENYPATGDPFGREPYFPNIVNPLFALEESETALPFHSSSSISVFTILDSGTGTIRSYAFDTRSPESEPLLFDEFAIDAAEDATLWPTSPRFTDGWILTDTFGYINESRLPWYFILGLDNWGYMADDSGWIFLPKPDS